jgi:hypothetical protein
MINDAAAPCQRSWLAVWYTHMKTTVDISDTLFESTRRLALQRGTTMRALIEEGLRSVLQAHRSLPRQFALRDASVGGDGLVDGVDLGDWTQIRALIYDETAR